ncbi:MAG: GGDEF and EAL domain-containing protein [Phycisphaerales bacterium]
MEQPTHRQIEQQLRGQTLTAERFRQVASHIDEAFWLSSPDEREIYYVSPTYETVVGRSCDSLYADPASWIESLHPDDRKRFREDMGTGGPNLKREGEYRLTARDDVPRWVRIRCVPIYDEDDRIVARAFFAMDVTERRELRSAALHDKLTRLPNRSLLTERLTEAIERSKSDPLYKFAVLFLDFDRFKIINDSLGHEVGDLLLISIAERLTANLRKRDNTSHFSEGHVAARLGGDEFVILLDDIRDTSDATAMADRLQTALSAAHSIRGHDVISTASIGIVTCAGEYDRAQDILRDADTAMYHAKSTGKARHVVFDERMHQEAVQRLELEEDLRRALDRQEFRLAYQPIIDLESGRLTGFEALLRWNHPQRGDVPPGLFIGLTEEIGLIVPLGAWVVREAATQLKKWHDQIPQDPPLEMNINLSRRQLGQDDLIDTLRRIIDETGVNPRSLKLEVTESAIMESPERVTGLLNELKDLGVKLCMDDFGTGYSSLSCLHHFPIDVLKIDRTFILNTDNNREYAAVIHAIITLAHTLKMTVVGEGVESSGQLAQLQALECDAAQGNFFSVPLSATAAEAYLRGPKGLAKSA